MKHVRNRCRFLAHNVIIHPLSGICWFLGFERAGDWLHEQMLSAVADDIRSRKP